jgi:hypothetical protein
MHIVPWFMQTAIFCTFALNFGKSKSLQISGSSRKNFIYFHSANTCPELLRMDLKESWNSPDFFASARFPHSESKLVGQLETQINVKETIEFLDKFYRSRQRKMSQARRQRSPEILSFTNVQGWPKSFKNSVTKQSFAECLTASSHA